MAENDKGKDLKDNTKEQSKTRKATMFLAKTIGYSSAAGLLGIIGKSLTRTEDLIKASGNLGISMNTSRTHFSKAVESTKGLTNEFAALGMAMDIQKSGIDGNSQNLIGLMAQERTLTGSHAKVLEAMVHLRKTLGFTDAQIEAMSVVVQKETNGRLVTTEKILEGMRNLGKSLETALVFGQEGPLVAAITTMNAKYPEMGDKISTVVDNLLDGTQKGLMHVMMAGVQQERNILLSNASLEDKVKAIESATIKWANASDSLTNQLGGFDKALGKEAFIAPILGNTAAAKSLSKIMLSTSKSTVDSRNKSHSAMMTLTAAWEHFLGVIQQHLIPVAAEILQYLSQLFRSEGFAENIKAVVDNAAQIVMALLQGFGLLVEGIAALVWAISVPFGLLASWIGSDADSQTKRGKDLSDSIEKLLAPMKKVAANTATLSDIAVAEERKRNQTTVRDIGSTIGEAFTARFRNNKDTARTNFLIESLIEQGDRAIRAQKRRGL
tara:strand:+ start:5522 stop:7009 length:1488 start_codon:yes stop_codon:yes gene_type:complete